MSEGEPMDSFAILKNSESYYACMWGMNVIAEMSSIRRMNYFSSWRHYENYI